MSRKSWPRVRFTSAVTACVTSLVVACGAPEDQSTEPVAPEKAAVSDPAALLLEPPPAPRIAPELPNTAELDQNDNRVDDALERTVSTLRATPPGLVTARAGAEAALREPIRLSVTFKRPVTRAELEAFVAAGGKLWLDYRGNP